MQGYIIASMCIYLSFIVDAELQVIQKSQPESNLMEEHGSDSDEETLQTQMWGVQRLERNELLDSLKVTIHVPMFLYIKAKFPCINSNFMHSQQDKSILSEQDQQVLSMIHDPLGM